MSFCESVVNRMNSSPFMLLCFADGNATKKKTIMCATRKLKFRKCNYIFLTVFFLQQFVQSKNTPLIQIAANMSD